MIKSENYIQIQGWMVTELKLSGNELLCYALIYGFSQDGNSVFSSSSKYICEWLNITQPTALAVLKKLQDKQLIEKIEKTINNVKLCDYRAILAPLKKFMGGAKETLVGGAKETLVHNNIIDNNKDNNIDIYTVKSFAKPTIEEIKAYCDERNNNVNAEQFYYYYESKGWMIGKNKMKNWKASVITWEKNRRRNGFCNEDGVPY